VARLRASVGRILLAGLLEAQARDVQRAYAPWLALTVCGRRDGWVALAGQR
jgi:ribosomal protein L11 methyltransferase